MDLGCPRCAAPLRTTRIDAPRRAGAVEVDTCSECCGMWIDRDALAIACPTASHLPDHAHEVTLLGERGAGIARCPRCEAVPIEITLVGVKIDFCVSCFGVWLDGGEYQALVPPRYPPDAPDPLPPPDTRGPYRMSAALAVSTGLVMCGDCRVRVPLEATLIWERGFQCKRCHAGVLGQAADRRVAQQAASDALGAILQAILGLIRALHPGVRRR